MHSYQSSCRWSGNVRRDYTIIIAAQHREKRSRDSLVVVHLAFLLVASQVSIVFGWPKSAIQNVGHLTLKTLSNVATSIIVCFVLYFKITPVDLINRLGNHHALLHTNLGKCPELNCYARALSSLFHFIHFHSRFYNMPLT